MRLPADATLIVVGAQEAIERPCPSVRDGRSVEANLASLIAAWRKEGLPVVHVRLDGASESPFEACGAPLQGETVIDASAESAFAGSGLEGLLDDAGATTLVLCGALNAVEPTARDAGDLGYQIFIPFDACWPAASAAARLSRETAAVVDTAAALNAAATAKMLERRESERKR